MLQSALCSFLQGNQSNNINVGISVCLSVASLANQVLNEVECMNYMKSGRCIAQYPRTSCLVVRFARKKDNLTPMGTALVVMTCLP